MHVENGFTLARPKGFARYVLPYVKPEAIVFQVIDLGDDFDGVQVDVREAFLAEVLQTKWRRLTLLKCLLREVELARIKDAWRRDIGNRFDGDFIAKNFDFAAIRESF